MSKPLSCSVYTALAAALLGLSLPAVCAAEQIQTASYAPVAPYRFIGKTINKAPKDKAEYRAIELANGMTVLLVSDPAANKSIMAAALPVGSKDDPISQQGMAHYLEHMIFMDSRHYPDVDGLTTFRQKNGGSPDANTTFARTAYHLQVNHDAFDEVVARMSACPFRCFRPNIPKKN